MNDDLPADQVGTNEHPFGAEVPGRLLWIVPAIMIVCVACTIATTRTLMFGWIFFALRTLPTVEVNWPLVMIGIGSFLGVVMLVQHLGTWFQANRPRPTIENGWRWRSSLSVSLLVVVMFCAGLSAVGVTHQSAWLIRSPQPWMVEKIGRYAPESETMQLQNQLRRLDLGILNYSDRYKQLPFRSEDAEGVPLSWPSRILGTLYSSSKGSLWYRDLPWDHEQNRDHFSRVFPVLLNPTLENAPQHNDVGYGLSHFAANENATRYSLEEYEGDTSGTIMIGEVRSQFQPWGKPNTHRSLEHGLNRHPNGFGGPPSRDGVMFLLMDGSVRTISDTVDPEVLRALSGVKR